ncbi:MAG: zf-HC2 domain-containing protein [Clostridia bacterium]|nr:zf-HC2 domain-containing protein [Clostridia bacterium]
MINCDIIKDMLPLYADGAVSSASCDMIQKHLMKCQNCRKAYALYRKNLRSGKTVELLPKETAYPYAGVVKKIRLAKAAEHAVALGLAVTAVIGIVSAVKNKTIVKRTIK